MAVNIGYLGEYRAMAEEALRNDGHGKHDDPAYYSRNLARLLLIAVDEVERLRGMCDTLIEAKNEVEASFSEALNGHKDHIERCEEALRKILEGSEDVRQAGLVEAARIYAERRSWVEKSSTEEPTS